MTDFNIRSYQATDLDAIYDICLKTGDSGQDATALYQNPKALGYLYAAPYVVLEPELAFVLEDEAGVCGYILGTFDTKNFNKRYQSEWLPALQAQYPAPTGEASSWTADERIYEQLHHPDLDVPLGLEPFPSHLHIDLLPRAQGKGNGRRLMLRFLAELIQRGSPGVHLGVGIRNTGAILFYMKMGFGRLRHESIPENSVVMVMPLG